jgi:REP element-mobilizing transposase RayT
MILAYHVILSAYGFWLPNDPRGSWSDFVAAWELVRFGKATKVSTRQSVAHVEHDRELRLRAKQALRFPPVCFTGKQALSVAQGFARAIEMSGYAAYACAILPEHVHLILGRCDRPVERVAGHLKAEATRQLEADGLHPFHGQRRRNGTRPSPWAERCWKVYMDNLGHVRGAIRYVEENPLKEGKRRQHWSFVRAWQE